MKFFNFFIWYALLIIISGNMAAQQSQPLVIEKIPTGKHIMVNGKFPGDEWNDALKKPMDEACLIFLKQDEKYLYIGIEFLKEKHTGIDLYLADSPGNRRMLHVSSALGEKEFVDSLWRDTVFGQNYLWTGNVINMYFEDGKNKIVEPDGFEFQIDKKMFPGKQWYVMMHFKRPEKIYPTSATDLDITRWFRINLD
jgi:hypothetical protein